MKISTFQLLFQKRLASRRGASNTSSYNANIQEIGHDLVELNSQWNNRLVPLTSTLPDSDGADSVDAFTNGLDGRTIYVDSSATSSHNIPYYDSLNKRPITIMEKFISVDNDISDLSTYITNIISNLSVTAADVSIVDAAGYYTSTNVEDALEEVMVAINNIVTGSGATQLDELTDVTLTAPLTNGHVLTYDSASNQWINAAPTGGGSGSPGGANTQVQFNDAGTFGGSASFVFDSTNSRVGIGPFPGGTFPTETLDVNGTIGIVEQSEPGDPVNGRSVVWVDSGTGDLMIKMNHGGTVKKTIMVDFSAIP